jgi:hypothetical protein
MDHCRLGIVPLLVHALDYSPAQERSRTRDVPYRDSGRLADKLRVMLAINVIRAKGVQQNLTDMPCDYLGKV